MSRSGQSATFANDSRPRLMSQLTKYSKPSSEPLPNTNQWAAYKSMLQPRP